MNPIKLRDKDGNAVGSCVLADDEDASNLTPAMKPYSIPCRYLADLNVMDPTDMQNEIDARSADFLAHLVASKCDPGTIAKFPQAVCVILTRLAIFATATNA